VVVVDVRIRTLVESKGELVRLDDTTPELRLRNDTYFDGVVTIEVKGRPVIDETFVDAVDWFWGFLWDRTKRFAAGADVTVGLNSLPYELALIHLTDRNARLSFSGRGVTVQRFCPADTLVEAIVTAADSYYRNMIRLARKQEREWPRTLDDVRAFRG
jgi:hypothetical protein